MRPPLDSYYIPPSINQYAGCQPVYFATVVPGLETVLQDEIFKKIPHAFLMDQMRGKVFFAASESFPLETLRCTDNIYRFLCPGDIGPHRGDLARFAETLSKNESIGFAISALEQQGRKTTFTVNASVTGKRNYSRFEAADVFSDTIQRKFAFVLGIHETRDVEFRLDIIGRRFLLSLKLTDAAFRFRGTNRQFTSAALRPTLAHALVWLSQPKPTDHFVDPFCGSGTIVGERASYPFTRLIGNDVDEQVLAAACENDPQKNAGVEWFNLDASALSLPDRSIDVIVTNPPWGRQIQAEDVTALYTGFLKKASLYLKENGRCLLLTPCVAELTQAAKQCGFAMQTTHTISLHGTCCYIHELTFSSKYN